MSNPLSPSLQPLLQRLEEAASADQVRFAVEAIAATGSAEAVPILIEALGYNNPGAAVAAVDGLIAIGEPAVLPLMELLDGFNYGARAWALRALSGIGDPRGMDLVIQASLEDFALSVRRAAARGVGTIHWQLMATDQVATAQQRALAALVQVCDEDTEWVVRYAAVAALEALGEKLVESLGEQRGLLLGQLNKLREQDESLTVRARSQLALERIGS